MSNLSKKYFLKFKIVITAPSHRIKHYRGLGALTFQTQLSIMTPLFPLKNKLLRNLCGPPLLAKKTLHPVV